VQKERAKATVRETGEPPIRGISVAALLVVVKAVSKTYHAKKQSGAAVNFETIIEDMVRINFADERAQHVAKHILGHFYAWRRNRSMPESAHAVARELNLALV
jgi:hypothetical protein